MTQLNRFFCVCCIFMLITPASFAQGNLIKRGKNAVKALTASPVKLPGITSHAASVLPNTVTATQLKIKFPEEYVQLEIPFPAESPVTETLAESISKKIEKVPAIGVLGGGNSNLSSTFKTPDGELVRKVVLGPEHFIKTNKAGSTIGYLKAQAMAYSLQGPNGEEILVAKNDKLRYLSDLKAVVKRDDFLAEYEVTEITINGEKVNLQGIVYRHLNKALSIRMHSENYNLEEGNVIMISVRDKNSGQIITKRLYHTTEVL